MDNINLLEWALHYAFLGWRVFPTKNKIPIVKNGCHAATTDPTIIQKWWTTHPTAQISIATGRETDLFIIDIDIKNNKNGLQTWTKKYGKLPITKHQHTPNNGIHILFKYPENLPDNIKLRCTVQALGEGIDTRGEGGSFVTAPSLGYQWNQSVNTILTVPDFIIDFFTPKQQSSQPHNLPTSANKYADATLLKILTEMENAPTGSRNHTLNGLAYRIGRLTARNQMHSYAKEELIKIAIAIGLTEQEVIQTFNSGFKAGLRVG
jgi:hypothetical protein